MPNLKVGPTYGAKDVGPTFRSGASAMRGPELQLGRAFVRISRSMFSAAWADWYFTCSLSPMN